MRRIINAFLNKRKQLMGQTTVITNGDDVYLYHRDYNTGYNYEVASIVNNKLIINDVSHDYCKSLRALLINSFINCGS